MKIILFTGLVFGSALFTATAFAECPSCSSAKSIEAAIEGARAAVGPLGDVTAVVKQTTGHGMEGGLYRVSMKDEEACTVDVQVTRYGAPGDLPGASHFRAAVVATTCPSPGPAGLERAAFIRKESGEPGR